MSTSVTLLRMIFEDRKEAGQKLAEALGAFRKSGDAIVVGLVRGGVVVAAEVATLLQLPLSGVVVRKIGAPGNEELALGAVAEEGQGVFNDELITLLGVSKEELEEEIIRQREWIKAYNKGCAAADFFGKTIVLVDDGIATGASMKVAIAFVRSKGAKKVVLAVPVASKEAIERLSELVDEAICRSTPSPFYSVGAFYREFTSITEEDVKRLYTQANEDGHRSL